METVIILLIILLGTIMICIIGHEVICFKKNYANREKRKYFKTIFKLSKESHNEDKLLDLLNRKSWKNNYSKDDENPFLYWDVQYSIDSVVRNFSTGVYWLKITKTVSEFNKDKKEYYVYYYTIHEFLDRFSLLNRSRL